MCATVVLQIIINDYRLSEIQIVDPDLISIAYMQKEFICYKFFPVPTCM